MGERAMLTDEDKQRIRELVNAACAAGYASHSERLITAAVLAARQAEFERCKAFVAKEHHGQKADDRCIEDDDRLYAFFGLPPCDRRVGDKAAMLKNCERFVERRCEGGGWPSYAELEDRCRRLRSSLSDLTAIAESHPDFQDPTRPNCDAYVAVTVANEVLRECPELEAKSHQ
jgi:hypothetical protein